MVAIIHSKRGGVGENLPLYIVFFIILAIDIIFISSMVSIYVEQANPLPEYLDIDIAASRIANSCFAYVDETGSVIQNQLDYKKINSENLKSCFEYADGSYESVKVVIKTTDKLLPLSAETSSSIPSKSVSRLCSLRLVIPLEGSVKVIPCTMEVFK